MGRYIDYRKDELLEMLWHLREIHTLTVLALRQHDPEGNHEQALNEFSSNGILRLSGDKITLTEKGLTKATAIIRRHRLAERLLSDVMGKDVEETETAACEFEHILAPEIVDSICTLLGHPEFCPHGLEIPAGKCCKESRGSISSAVVALLDLKVGESAKVASINMTDHTKVNKLTSSGITTGTLVTVQQLKPTIVLEVNKNLVAMDRELGAEVKVWKPNE